MVLLVEGAGDFQPQPTPIHLEEGPKVEIRGKRFGGPLLWGESQRHRYSPEGAILENQREGVYIQWQYGLVPKKKNISLRSAS